MNRHNLTTESPFALLRTSRKTAGTRHHERKLRYNLRNRRQVTEVAK